MAMAMPWPEGSVRHASVRQCQRQGAVAQQHGRWQGAVAQQQHGGGQMAAPRPEPVVVCVGRRRRSAPPPGVASCRHGHPRRVGPAVCSRNIQKRPEHSETLADRQRTHGGEKARWRRSDNGREMHFVSKAENIQQSTRAETKQTAEKGQRSNNREQKHDQRNSKRNNNKKNNTKNNTNTNDQQHQHQQQQQPQQQQQEHSVIETPTRTNCGFTVVNVHRPRRASAAVGRRLGAIDLVPPT